MSGWLLDTNVISELRRPRPNARVRDLIAAQPLDQLFVSGHVGQDPLRHPEGCGCAAPCRAVPCRAVPCRAVPCRAVPCRAEIEEWLTHKVRPLFDQRVLEVSEDVMLEWRLLVEEGRKAGHTFSQPDLIIAATARHHGLTVVSRDTVDFRLARVALLDPWAASAP